VTVVYKIFSVKWTRIVNLGSMFNDFHKPGAMTGRPSCDHNFSGESIGRVPCPGPDGGRRWCRVGKGRQGGAPDCGCYAILMETNGG